MKYILHVFLIVYSIACYPQKIFHADNDYHHVPHYKVIIIGAGISGLAAANVLAKKHIPVMVLEARNRIGGRIHTTYPWGPGLDLGAGWIHGINNNPVAAMVRQLHITTLPTAYNDNDSIEKFKSFDIYASQDEKLSPWQIKKLINLIKQFDEFVDLDQKQFRNASIEDVFKVFIQQHPMSEYEARLLQYLILNVYIYEFAADINTLSARANFPYKNSLVSGKNELFPYGYSQILPELTKNIPIILNQPVKKIQYDKNGVDIFTDYHHYHADYVVITVPLGVLKSGAIEFSPALPQAKREAINNLDMAVYNKIYLFFEYPFWNKKSEWIGYIPASKNKQLPADIMNYYKFTHMPILILFTGGSLAKEVEQLSDQKTIDYAMSELEKIYGKHIPKPSAYVITRWQGDPFSRGSYSYLPKGVDINNYRVLSQPVLNRLFFAGEATSLSDPATVHGAYATGIRAGKEIIHILH